jgi:hypothetical protein
MPFHTIGEHLASFGEILHLSLTAGDPGPGEGAIFRRRRLDSGGRLVHLAEWVYNPAAGGQI